MFMGTSPKENNLKLRIAVLLAALTLFVTGSAFAQNGAFAPYANANISFTGTGNNAIGVNLTGVSNPNYRVGGGIESSTKHLLLDANLQFDSASFAGIENVFKNTGGYTLTGTASAYYKLGGVLLVGAGGYYSNQVLSGTTLQGEGQSIATSFNRNQIRPFVGGGFNFKHDRILVNYVLPGKDRLNTGNLLGGAGVVTGFNDRTVNVQNEVFLGTSGLRKHIRLTQNVSISSSNQLGNLITNVNNLRSAGVTAGVGIKFVL